jgi:hypothetical protein
MLLRGPGPGSRRPWALPFLPVLAPSAQANRKAGKRHKTTVDWTSQRVKVVSRWLRKRPWGLLGEGGYAGVRLAGACVAHQVTRMSRLRLDARLYAFPQPTPPGKRGPKPQQGARCPTLHALVNDEEQAWDEVEVPWYGGEGKRVRRCSGVCLWHTPGEPPIPIRGVLVVDPDGLLRPEACFSTACDLAPATIVAWFVRRWHVAVTCEEGRRHLGVATQRQCVSGDLKLHVNGQGDIGC